MNDADLTSPLEEWVRNIRDVYRLHKKELDSIEDKDLRTRRLVELNAQEQALNVYKTAVVQRRRVYTHLRWETPRPASVPLYEDFFRNGSLMVCLLSSVVISWGRAMGSMAVSEQEETLEEVGGRESHGEG